MRLVIQMAMFGVCLGLKITFALCHGHLGQLLINAHCRDVNDMMIVMPKRAVPIHHGCPARLGALNHVINVMEVFLNEFVGLF